MKRIFPSAGCSIFLTALAGVLVLSGCARSYTIIMNNGERIQTRGKPKLENGFYYFKDASGQQARPVFSARVQEVSPTSMASPDPASVFKPVSSK